MTVYGATSSVPRVPAKVPRLNGQGTFSLGRGNASSCPISDPHDGGLGLPHLHRERSWVGWWAVDADVVERTRHSGVVLLQLTRDDHALGLIGAVSDLVDLCVAVIALDRIFLGVGAAGDLHRVDHARIARG